MWSDYFCFEVFQFGWTTFNEVAVRIAISISKGFQIILIIAWVELQVGITYDINFKVLPEIC